MLCFAMSEDEFSKLRGVFGNWWESLEELNECVVQYDRDLDGCNVRRG